VAPVTEEEYAAVVAEADTLDKKWRFIKRSVPAHLPSTTPYRSVCLQCCAGAYTDPLFGST